MSKNNVVELSGPEQFTDSLTDLLRAGARQLIEQAVEAELAEFMKQYVAQFWPMGGRPTFVMATNRNARSRLASGRSRSK